MTYWPGTTIPRSTGNAFDMKTCKGELVKHIATAQQKRESGLQGARVQQTNRAARR